MQCNAMHAMQCMQCNACNEKEADNCVSLCVDEYPEDTFVSDNCVIGANMAASIDGT